MAHINWDKNPYDAVDDGTYFNLDGIQVPTYGLNGGADWTLGQFGGSTLDDAGHPLKPEYVDRIDKLFWFHDQAYDLNPTADVLPEADLKLASQLVKLNDNQLSDPEASFYAGITTVGMVYQIETTDPSLLSATQAAYFTADAYHNIEVGIAGMNTYEQVQALDLLVDFSALLLGEAFSFSVTAGALEEAVNGISSLGLAHANEIQSPNFEQHVETVAADLAIPFLSELAKSVPDNVQLTGLNAAQDLRGLNAAQDWIQDYWLI